jgi:hypothetical protein
VARLLNIRCSTLNYTGSAVAKKIIKSQIPHFTGSLDARVPGEEIVFVQRIDGTGRWLAFSKASDGSIFHSDGATEPLARRGAGLLTFAHLQERADGTIAGQTSEEIISAKMELRRELQKLILSIKESNQDFPPQYPKSILIIELRAANKIINYNEKSIIARWLLPPLIFLAGAFAEGLIGSYAEKTIESLTRFLTK